MFGGSRIESPIRADEHSQSFSTLFEAVQRIRNEKRACIFGSAFHLSVSPTRGSARPAPHSSDATLGDSALPGEPPYQATESASLPSRASHPIAFNSKNLTPCPPTISHIPISDSNPGPCYISGRRSIPMPYPKTPPVSRQKQKYQTNPFFLPTRTK